MKKIHFLVAVVFVSLLLMPNSASGELDDIRDCTPTREEDIGAAVDAIVRNWDDFEFFVERETGFNIKSCMRNRFEENGIVICESSDTGSCNGAVAWASPFTKKVHLCPSLFRNVDAISRKPDRRACYAAILTHEFAHSCDRFEPGADRLDEAAFDWYASTHDLTITKTACGFN